MAPLAASAREIAPANPINCFFIFHSFEFYGLEWSLKYEPVTCFLLIACAAKIDNAIVSTIISITIAVYGLNKIRTTQQIDTVAIMIALSELIISFMSVLV